MTKKIIKILLATFLISVLAILYLSIFGIKTNKFNNQITKNILKINNKINLNLKDVKYLLNPYNFTINIETKNPQISLEGKTLGIKEIRTNVALKALMNNQFSIDYLKFKTKEIKLNDLISAVKVFQNSPQLFVLNKVIKDGLIYINVSLNFDEKGKIKEDYKVEGSVKEVTLNILNKFKLKDLNFNFDIKNNIYLLKQIKTKLNDTKITSPLIKFQERKKYFFVDGQFSSDKKNFDIEELKLIFSNLNSNIDFKKIIFSSNNYFSFNVSKQLKFDNLKVKSTINLKELIFNEDRLKLNLFLPSFANEIKLTEHKIIIDYNKRKLEIEGNGNILLEEKLDNLSYKILKNKKNLRFNSKINLKNNSLLLNFLDYEKKKNINSTISVKGNFKKNNQLEIDLINLKENNNEILIKGLYLSKKFKITDIENFSVNYKNNKEILNKFNLKKDNLDYIIEGDSFDASKIINIIMDSDEENLSIFKNLNSKIKIRIKKTYIDEVNYLDNLNGDINYKNNKIENLKLDSTFFNKKTINLSIKTNKNLETITKLISTYPKPLIRRYDFIKGFEGGYLNFYSTKKGDVTNSVLIIDNFKVKEVPVFARLLSLASLQGIADLLTGEGIRFTDFEMKFSKERGLTTIEEMYAIGPAVSILMDGYIESKKLVSLRGTLVPATTINRSIASIPLLGNILIGKKAGEGVFGVSFKIKGPPKNLKTTVNPVKTLTPRFITRTLEKLKKN